MKLFKSFSIVAGLILFSSFLGYLRDALLAAEFGASIETDAYFAAFFVPNTLYLILVAGSVSTVFIPVFIEYLDIDRVEAWYIASVVFNVLFLALGFIILVCLLTVDVWMPLLYPGYSIHAESLAVDLTMIMLPMLLFVGLSSFISAIINSFEHFTIPAFAPVLSNVIVIASIVISSSYGGIYVVAFGVLLGMVVQLLIQIPVLYRFDAKYEFVIRLGHPAVRRIGTLMLPVIIYLFVAYTSLVVERMIASNYEEGTISALNYAMRLFSLPITVFIGALGTVIYPRLSIQAARGDSEALKKNLTKAIKVAIFILAPISVWIIINSRFVVRLLFGYGSFTNDDIVLTAIFLSGYTIGMVAVGTTSLLQRGFYAKQDTLKPLLIELSNLALYISMALSLTYIFGMKGLAIARGFSFNIIAIVSFVVFNKYVLKLINSWTGKRFVIARYILTCFFTALIWSVPLGISSVLNSINLSEVFKIIIITIFGSIGLVVYVFLINRLGLLDKTYYFREIWAYTKQQLRIL